jgi:pimeloyl-ACP methyl ester carboxylesterase
VTTTIAARSVTLDAGVFTYREAGPADGPPVVMLHGLGSKAATWDRVAAELAGRARSPTSADMATQRVRLTTRSSSCATTPPASPTRSGWTSSS